MSQQSFEDFEEKLENEAEELRRDQLFSHRLDSDLRFEARPKIQAALRARLLSNMVVAETLTPARPARRRWFTIPTLQPWQLGIVGVMLFTVSLTVVLVVLSLTEQDASNPNNNTVAVTTVDQFNDVVANQNLNIEAASKELAFTPSQPAYLARGWKPNSASIYKAMPRPPRDAQNKPLPGNPPQQASLQIKYSTGDTTQILEVYQGRLLPNLPPEAQGKMTEAMFNFFGKLNKFKEQQVQGVKGFLIEDNNWRLNFGFFGRPEAENPAKKSDVPPTGLVNFYGSQGGPPGMGGSLEYRAPDNQKPLKALVWHREGVVLVLVSGDTISTDELLKIAESFK